MSLSKLWSSQLLKHNVAAIELQIGPSSNFKQECDTLVTAMVYHFLAPEGGHPTREKNLIEKIPECKVLFFLIHTSKANQQNQRDVVSKSVANIYRSYKYDFFPVILLLTNHEALFNLNIVLIFHSPFEPISALSTISGL